MSAIIEIDDSGSLRDLIDTEREMVITFTAPSWCQPCIQLKPHLETAAEKSESTFVTVDIDRADWAMTEYGVRGVPTVMLYRDGEYVKNLQERTAIKLLNEVNDA